MFTGMSDVAPKVDHVEVTVDGRPAVADPREIVFQVDYDTIRGNAVVGFRPQEGGDHEHVMLGGEAPRSHFYYPRDDVPLVHRDTDEIACNSVCDCEEPVHVKEWWCPVCEKVLDPVVREVTSQVGATWTVTAELQRNDYLTKAEVERRIVTLEVTSESGATVQVNGMIGRPDEFLVPLPPTVTFAGRKYAPRGLAGRFG